MAEASDRQRLIYETALNSTPDFVYVFDLEHRAQYANEALLRVWGVEDVRGKTWMDLGYEQWHADMHDRELALVIRTGAPIRGEIPFTGTNGERVYDYIFSPVLDAAGAVVRWPAPRATVTERKAAELVLREHAETAGGGRPRQGRLPGHAVARDAQPAGASAQRPRDPAHDQRAGQRAGACTP